MGEAQVRDQADQPGQPAQIRDHRRRLGSRRGLERRGDAGGAGLQREVLLLSGLARGARTRSRRRAASTRRRTTRTTATACSGSSTTRSRAATSARARRTCIGSRRVSATIIDQCVAQGVPFAREYGGLLANRCFGGAQVSRTFYARGQTGQQLLLGAYQRSERQIAGNGWRCSRAPRCSTSCSSTATREESSSATWSPARSVARGRRVVLAHRRLRQRLLPLDQRQGLQRHRHLARVQARRAASPTPAYTQIHPTCIPVSGDYQSKLTLMSESLRNDGRVWVPKKKGDNAPAGSDPRGRARLLPRAEISELRQPRAARHRLARREGSVRRRPRRRPGGLGVYLDFARCHQAPRRATRSASATATSSTCTSGSPAKIPTRCRCASTRPSLHDGRPVGGLQPDDARSPDCFVLGEANFSDHGANRLGAQRAHAGPRRRLLRAPVHHRQLPRRQLEPNRAPRDHRRVREAESRRRARRPNGCSASRATAPSILSTASWAASCGITAAWRARGRACASPLARIPALREEFWGNVKVPAKATELNQSAGEGRPRRRLPRVRRADVPATRSTATSPAAAISAKNTRLPTARRSATTTNFAYVAAWEFAGDGKQPVLPQEPLAFE